MNDTAPTVLRLQSKDNIVVALMPLAPGAPVAGGVAAAEAIPAGHKVAVRAIAVGEPVLKYGQIIGTATRPIDAGAHVHVQNLGMGDHRQDYGFGSAVAPLPPADVPAWFRGFHRPSGRVGTRNYIGVLTSVNCSGSVARFIAEEATRQGWLRDFPNVDGIVPIVHGTGCGMSG